MNKATLQQDRAAGGAGRRKIKIKSGDIVTVSLITSSKQSPYRVILRFKSGLTIQREVGRFEATSPEEAVLIGWQMIRPDKVVEHQGWSWVES